MQWGLAAIGGACTAIVLGIAIVAPSGSRGPGPEATPTDAILAGRNTRPGAFTTRILVPVPVPVPEKPEEGQALPPTPAPEKAPEDTNQGPGTASEASTD